MAPRLSVLQWVNVTFAGALDYNSYRLHHRFLKYNGKMATRTAKIVRCMEKIMKAYQIKELDPETMLFFLRQLERACDYNQISNPKV